ncbi:MAG TPA: hypothetical protein VLF40_00280 [Candidatus Saccharimonadales bacterium]|nr:hypothetical protein [Candidatus Saccharimonadales bacterium]
MTTVALSHASTQEYSLEQISCFLLTEKVGVHGIGPDAYEQNVILAEELAAVGEGLGPNLLAVHLLGSRAHGGSWRESDADLCVVRSDNAVKYDVEDRLVRTLRQRFGNYVNVDVQAAAGYLGVDSVIPLPNDPEAFARWVMQSSWESMVLYHEGGYDTVERRLGGLAALAVRYANPDSVMDWKWVRDGYAQVFLGKRIRTCEKVAERLHLHEDEVAKVITEDLIQERAKLFGLDADFRAYYEQELAWLEVNRDELAENWWYGLHQAVLELS